MDEDTFIFNNILNSSVVLPGCFLKYGSKYVLGDQKGVTSFFSLRKNSSTKKYTGDLIFTHNDPKENPIRSVATSKERIFTAVGTQVRAISRKGRTVKDHDNNLPIHGVGALKSHIVFFNDYFLYRLLDGKDEPEMFLSNEKILTIFLYGKYVYFCCNNQTINRIVLADEEFDSIDHTFYVPHNVTSFCLHEGKLYFGTLKGAVGFLDVKSHDDVKPKILLEMDKGLSIQSLAFFHFKDADPQDSENFHLAVGFGNGELRVFSSDFKTEYLSKKIQGTSITNIHPTPDFQSILLSTYSGEIAILSIKHQSGLVSSSSSSSSQSIARKYNEEKKKLIESVNYRERLLKDLKRRYIKLSREHVGTKLTYTPRCRFFLVDDYYLLSVRCDVNIDTVILQSNSVRVNILGKPPEGFDLCKSYHRESSSCYFLLTALNDQSKGLELRCRTLEGNYGDLEVFVIPLRTPKISTKVVIPIKPLSLHERVAIEEEEDDEEEEEENEGEEEEGEIKSSKKKKNKNEKNFSTLKISGEFSLETVHHWIWSCCNDLPLRIVGKKKEMEYSFKNSYQGTFLRVKYKENEIEFESDNISTISILEEFISKQATVKNTKVRVSFKINFKSISDMVKSHIFPALEEEFMYQEKMHVLESIKEMSEHGGGLVKNNLDILKQEEEIRERLKKKKVNLQFLYDILVRLCRDQAKFKRKSPQTSLISLRNLLQGDYKSLTLEKLLNVFSSKD